MGKKIAPERRNPQDEVDRQTMTWVSQELTIHTTAKKLAKSFMS